MTTQTITQSEHDQLLAGYEKPTEIPDTTFDSPLLRLFVSAGRENLTQSFVERWCQPGEIIFREGTPGDTMYMIYSGRVVVFKGKFTSPTVLGYRGPGDIIGEMAVLEHRPRSATVVALDDVRLMGISRERFQKLLVDTPSVGLNVMAMLSSRLRKSDEARSQGELSEKRLVGQVSELQIEKHRLEELQRLRQETSDFIIHDLRNPLSAISVAIKMLGISLPETTIQENRELIEIAESGCERLQLLISTLLEVSQMESGETALAISDVELNTVAKEVIAKSSILNRKSIVFQAQFPEDLPRVMADRIQIERVLTNLIDNAIKHTPEKGRITVGAEPQGKFMQVSVTDSGYGIPLEEREHIFERFAQVASEKRKRRGFGLGLTFCRLAVEAHGGRIWVEAGDDNVGSRFIFTLPI